MRIFGNFGTVHIGAVAGVDFYWKRQWLVFYKASTATLIKEVKLSSEDLKAFYINGGCESGSMVLELSQGDTKKEIDLAGKSDKPVDMSQFHSGLLKMVIRMKSAKKIKVKIGWRK